MADERVPSEGVAPKFTTELTTQEVLIGQPVTMSCDVIGTPAPDITWYQVRNVVIFCLNNKKSLQNMLFIDCSVSQTGYIFTL